MFWIDAENYKKSVSNGAKGKYNGASEIFTAHT